MQSRSEIQNQWNSLTGSDFEKAIILLCDYVEMELTQGVVLTDQPDKLNLVFSDRNHSELIKKQLIYLFKYYGQNDYLLEQGLMCIVPYLIAMIKRAVYFEGSILSQDETLYEILTVICLNTGLQYEEVSTNPFEYITKKWILSDCLTSPLPSFLELQDVILKNQAIIRSKFADELPQFSRKIEIVNNDYGIIALCVMAGDDVFVSRRREPVEELINVRIYISILANTILKCDLENQEAVKDLLNHEDMLNAIRQYPFALIKKIAYNQGGSIQAKICIDIFESLGLLTFASSEDNTFYCKHFFDLDKNKSLDALESNISFAQPLISTVIQTAEEAEIVCKKLIRDYPNLFRYTAKLFPMNINSILYDEAKKSYPKFGRLFKTFPGEFDLKYREPIDGRTVMHAAAEVCSITSKCNLVDLISLDKDALFIRDNQGKLPADLIFSWPIQRETCWEQVKTFLSGLKDFQSNCSGLPKEIFLCITLLTAKAHCENQPLSALEIKAEFAPGRWCKKYKETLAALDAEENNACRI